MKNIKFSILLVVLVVVASLLFVSMHNIERDKTQVAIKPPKHEEFEKIKREFLKRYESIAAKRDEASSVRRGIERLREKRSAMLAAGESVKASDGLMEDKEQFLSDVEKSIASEENKTICETARDLLPLWEAAHWCSCCGDISSYGTDPVPDVIDRNLRLCISKKDARRRFTLSDSSVWLKWTDVSIIVLPRLYEANNKLRKANDKFTSMKKDLSKLISHLSEEEGILVELQSLIHGHKPGDTIDVTGKSYTYEQVEKGIQLREEYVESLKEVIESKSSFCAEFDNKLSDAKFLVENFDDMLYEIFFGILS
jgi:hypothetical protein